MEVRRSWMLFDSLCNIAIFENLIYENFVNELNFLEIVLLRIIARRMLHILWIALPENVDLII